MINQITKSQAITSLVPDLVFHLYPDGKIELANIDGQENTGTIPSEEAITDEMTRLQADYDSKDYSRKRRAEYNKLNQYEMQFDDQRDSTTTWVDAINAIKAAHPKP